MKAAKAKRTTYAALIPPRTQEARAAVAEAMGIDGGDWSWAFGRPAGYLSRHADYIRARTMLALVMRELGCSYPEAAVACGFRTHTSARDRIMRASPEEREQAAAIAAKIGRVMP